MIWLLIGLALDLGSNDTSLLVVKYWCLFYVEGYPDPDCKELRPNKICTHSTERKHNGLITRA